MRKPITFMITLIIILIILCNYNETDKVMSTSTNTDLVNKDNSDYVTVDIIYEQDMGSNTVTQVQRAIELYPVKVIKAFVKDGWKISVVSEIDLTGTEFEGSTNPLTVGMTNYDAKTIQIVPVQKNSPTDKSILTRTVHELAHYADKFYDNAADTVEWKTLYSKYQNSYIEFEYSGIKETESNRNDIKYATSNRWEFFACTMKDYYCNPKYLRDNYREIYDYFIILHTAN